MSRKGYSVLFALVSLVAQGAAFAAPRGDGQTEWITVQADHTNLRYDEWQRPMFTIQTLTKPTNPDFSLVVEASFPGGTDTVKLLKYGDLYQYYTNPMPPGTPVFTAKAYVEDTSTTKAHKNAITQLSARINEYRWLLTQTTDPVKTAAYQKEIARDLASVAALEAKIATLRTMVEELSLQLKVVDHTPPAITMQEGGLNYTPDMGYSVNISVQDLSPTTTKIYRNGVEVYATAEKNFTAPFGLIEGPNTINAVATDIDGNQTGTPPGQLTMILDTTLPTVALGREDNLFVSNPVFELPVAVTDASPTTTKVYFNDALLQTTPDKTFTAMLPLVEGTNTVRVVSTDNTGHESASAVLGHIVLDTQKPVIAINTPDHQIVGGILFDVPVTVADATATFTRVIVNGLEAQTSTQSSFTAQVMLRTGLNMIEVAATDAAGNVSDSAWLLDILLDTAPPLLSDIVPVPNTVFDSLTFIVSANSNEELQAARVNGFDLTLAPDKKSFSGIYDAVTEGPANLYIEAYDAAGNRTTADIPIDIRLRALYGDLLSVAPDADGVHLAIIGAPGASKSGITVHASAGIFNFGSAVAAANGSFRILLNPFSEAEVSATDPVTGRTDTATVTFQMDTHLAGKIMAPPRSLRKVKDPEEGIPLPGVTVSLAGSSQSVVTDGSGIFRFPTPVTGDQTLIVDGTTVPPEITGPARKFSKISVTLSIGLSQSNVLQRPIYLQPLVLDGTSTVVTQGTAATVTNPNAPGVTMEILPTTQIVFPDGSHAGEIAMTVTEARYSSIESMEFTKPTDVVTLEPSGLKFSEPVPLVLPNSNNLPAGVELVIMSMNSQKGIWEIDGVARVSDDGQRVETKPGAGITHFSQIYASPVGPTVRKVGSPEVPGTDTFNGALTTSIKLPAYKSMGQDVSPSLIYRSSWAKPTSVVSNFFDVPRGEISLNNDSGFRKISYQRCTYFPWWHCWIDEETYYRETVTGSAWYQPSEVTSQFFMAGIASELLHFTGVPNRAVVSYAMDLKDTQTGEYLPSGVYPYFAKWQMKLEHVVVGTRTQEIRGSGYLPLIIQTSLDETREIEKVFPADIGGPVYVQNEINSSAGRGWKVAGVPKIANPTADRVMIEEGDGTVSGYAVQNTMHTAFYGENTGAKLDQGVAFNAWPKVHVSLGNGIGEVDLSSPGPVVNRLNTFSTLGGSIHGMQYGWHGDRVDCFYPYGAYSASRSTQKILALPNGKNYATDSMWHQVYEAQSGADATVFAGRFMGDAGPHDWRYSFGDLAGLTNAYCKDAIGHDCDIIEVSVALNQTSCMNVNFSQGVRPWKGYDGEGVLTHLMNAPMDLIGYDNMILVADQGNNRVRRVNLTTNTIETIAGNGSYYPQDTGDGGAATGATLFHPRGLARDALGNIYVSTERGTIRKVDASTGVITHFAGKPSGGSLIDTAPASDILLSNPTGLVVDNQNGYLYVADSGHHRVVRIDFATRTANTVAGSGVIGDAEEGLPALGAALSSPTWLGLDGENNLLIVDSGNNKIRRVIFQSATSGVLAFASTAEDKPGVRRNTDGSWVPYLQKLGDGSFVRNFRDGRREFFASSGKITSSIDRANREVTYSYDADGRIVAISDPVQRTTEFTYTNGKLASIKDPANRTTYFTHNGDGMLAQVMYSDATQKSFSYDAGGLMTAETNERGHQTQYTYNEWNRLKEVIRPDSTKMTINDSTTKTMANNYTGGNTGTLKSMGTGQDQAYDGIKDAKNIETKFVKDFKGYVTTVEDALGRVTEIKRSKSGKPIEIKRPDATTVTFQYDNVTDDLVSQTDTATSVTTSQVYDAYGNVTSQTNGRGFTSTSQYDPVMGLLLSKTDPLNHTVSYQYNHAQKLLTAEINALGRTTSYTHDANGNVVAVADPMNQVTSHVRDTAGNITSTTNAKGQVSQYEFDAFSRLTAVITPKNERTEYQYLPTGELSRIKDPLNNLTTFEYNTLGQLTKKTDSLGFQVTRAYDENGNVTSETDQNGNVKTFTYDSINQLTQKTLPDNVISLGYDVRGNMTSAANNESRVELGYDIASRLTSARSYGLGPMQNLPDVSLNYGYDQNNNRVSMTDPIGTTNYVFDQVDRLTSITNPKGEVYSFGFDNGSRLTSITRPGSTSALAFDDVNFLTSITHNKSGGTNIASFEYWRDQIGNRTKIRTVAGDKDFGYDNNSQLVSATNPEAPASHQSETYSYDEIANRTTDQAGSYQYDLKKQRLVEDYRSFYFFDNNGNMIKRQAKANFPYSDISNFYYSSENQLIGFKLFEGGAAQPTKEVVYTYDALGRRIAKTVVDHTAPTDPRKTFNRRYVYDGQNIALEYTLDSDFNKLLARYTHSPLAPDDVLAADITADGVTAQLAQNAGTAIYIKDAQGTVTDVTDSTGMKLMHYVYSAFGELIGIKDAYGADVSSAPPVATSFTYTGREHDSESGYYYYRARYYDPAIGRFLQKDPHPGVLENPTTVVNGNAYVGNNPTNITDSTGMFWGELLGFLGAVALTAITFGTAAFLIGGAYALIGGASIGAAAITGVTAGLWAGAIAGGIAAIAALIDPAWALSMSMVAFSFSPLGLIANAAITGSLPGISMVRGRPVVTNSMFGGSAGFTPGPISFVPVGVTKDTVYHELGHQMQYEKYGGYSYLDYGWEYHGYANWFECEAGSMAAKAYGGGPYNTGYKCGK